MSAISGWFAGVLLAVAICHSADLGLDSQMLFGASLSLFGLILGRIADRLRPR
jgi:hypothetical protein